MSGWDYQRKPPLLSIFSIFPCFSPVFSSGSYVYTFTGTMGEELGGNGNQFRLHKATNKHINSAGTSSWTNQLFDSPPRQTLSHQSVTNIFFLTEYEYKYIRFFNIDRIWISNIFVIKISNEYEYQIYIRPTNIRIFEYFYEYKSFSFKSIHNYRYL